MGLRMWIRAFPYIYYAWKEQVKKKRKAIAKKIKRWLIEKIEKIFIWIEEKAHKIIKRIDNKLLDVVNKTWL